MVQKLMGAHGSSNLHTTQIMSEPRTTPELPSTVANSTDSSNMSVDIKISEESELREKLNELERWSPLKIDWLGRDPQDPSPQAFHLEHLWIVFCDTLVRDLEDSRRADDWLGGSKSPVYCVLQFVTLRAFARARQEGQLSYGNETFIPLAGGSYENLIKHLANVDLDDDYAFLQANEATHLRIASYHSRIAASHRSLVRRLRAEIESVTGKHYITKG